MQNIYVNYYYSSSSIDLVYLEPQPNTHNGKLWFCFDNQTCDAVIYWSNSGTHANKWVYSLTGLNGVAVSTLSLNPINIDYPITSFEVDETPQYTWTNLSQEDGINFTSFNILIDSTDCQSSNDGLSECLGELAGYFSEEDFADLLDKGFVEDGTIQGRSQLCKIKDILLQLDPTLTPNEIAAYFSVILDRGLVVDVNGCQVVTGSVETYLKYAEAVGLTQSANVP